MDRRDFLKGLASLPLLGLAGVLESEPEWKFDFKNKADFYGTVPFGAVCVAKIDGEVRTLPAVVTRYEKDGTCDADIAIPDHVWKNGGKVELFAIGVK